MVRAVEKARPTVVNVNTEEEVAVSPFGGGGDPIFDRFFRDFFEAAPRRRVASRSLGSGVIVDPRGYILTNEHVVARASRISVTLADERTYPAKLVGTDPDHDLAVIKVDAKEPFPAVETGDSDRLLIGEQVIAIGNPFGLTHTVTTGVVSATRRSIRTGQGRLYYDFVQTDAAINPGNSGGPLLDITGRMIGVNTAIYSEGMGIGFAIPAAVARRVVEDLVRYGQVQAVWVGLAVGDARERPGSRRPASDPAAACRCCGSPRRALRLGPGSTRATCPRGRRRRGALRRGVPLPASAATASARRSRSPCAGGRRRSISPCARSSSRPRSPGRSPGSGSGSR